MTRYVLRRTLQAVAVLLIVSIVVFALLIAFSIALHEVGHLVPAKAFGIKVTEYMVGFGPTVWSRLKGETRYGLKAIPLGGYIRMVGMLPPAPDGTSRSMSTGRFATMVADARRQSLEEVIPGEEDRAFYRHPVHQRMIVMLGGPTMNLLLAFVLFAIVLVGIGIPQPTTQVDSIAACTPALAKDASGAPVLVDEPLPSGECPTGTTASPASLAGLSSGDTIVAVDGVGSWGVEMFQTADGSLLINELAPRVHNSGHYTIEGCVCSQFENHVRAAFAAAAARVTESSVVSLSISSKRPA